MTMQIHIVIEIQDTSASVDDICDGLREAGITAAANMRSMGLLRVDQERYIAENITNPAIGQVSYYRPE